MKKYTIPASILCFVFILFSCSKKETPDPVDTNLHVGFWKGKFSSSVDSALNKDMAFLVRSDNTFRAYTLSPDTILAGKAEGTYIVSGTQFNGSYQYPSISGFVFVRGNFNTATTAFTGTWGENSASTNGNISLQKQ